MSAEDDSGTLGLLRGFLDRVHLATPGDLPGVVRQSGRDLGWTVTLYLVDPEQLVLVPAPVPGVDVGEPQGVDGTLAGRAFRTVQPVPLPAGEHGVWLPVLDGVDRLGVLKVVAPSGTDLDDPVFRDRCRLLAHVTGHLVVAKAPYGDSFERVRRQRPRTVASELLWELLPPRTFGCDGLLLSGLLEPCYDVAADAFDYAVSDGVAHLGVMDATGHDLRGTLLAAVALAAYRSSRRGGKDLEETVGAMDRYVAEQGGSNAFVSAVLGELDLRTGRLRYVNAGHPPPLLMRRGKVVKQLDGGHRILLGLSEEDPVAAEEWLEPDDWIVFYTDGITEARDAEGRFFGLERLTDQLERSAASGQPAPETLRRVILDVLAHQQGVLQDDATLLVVQWATNQERAFTADSRGSGAGGPETT